MRWRRMRLLAIPSVSGSCVAVRASAVYTTCGDAPGQSCARSDFGPSTAGSSRKPCCTSWRSQPPPWRFCPSRWRSSIYASTELLPKAAPAGTSVSVLIPARNEEENIAECVLAALASKDVVTEVVVLDDHSDDRTAAIVEDLARRDLRVRLERAPSLPPGWCGKQHACQMLAQRRDIRCCCLSMPTCASLPKPPVRPRAFSSAVISVWPAASSPDNGERGGATDDPARPPLVAGIPPMALMRRRSMSDWRRRPVHHRPQGSYISAGGPLDPRLSA